jgi:hypothetical protein
VSLERLAGRFDEGMMRHGSRLLAMEIILGHDCRIMPQGRRKSRKKDSDPFRLVVMANMKILAPLPPEALVKLGD